MSQLPAGDPRHGLNGYTNLGCRCPVCREAQRRAQASARKARAAALRADPSLAPHGSVSTYQNWRCRCPSCTAASTASKRKYPTRTRGTTS